MITPDGWFDWAERMPGPQAKLWPDANKLRGVVLHSAVGSIQGVIDVVLGAAQVSVTGVVGYDGRFVQFYPVTASPWANGSHEANRSFLGFEHEGGKPGNESEPLTPEQVAADVRILQDLAAYKGVGVDFWQRPTTLIEHREIYATACPSGRIPWDTILSALAPPVPPPAPYVTYNKIGFSDGTEWYLAVKPPEGVTP